MKTTRIALKSTFQLPDPKQLIAKTMDSSEKKLADVGMQGSDTLDLPSQLLWPTGKIGSDYATLSASSKL